MLKQKNTINYSYTFLQIYTKLNSNITDIVNIKSHLQANFTLSSMESFIASDAWNVVVGYLNTLDKLMLYYAGLDTLPAFDKLTNFVKMAGENERLLVWLHENNHYHPHHAKNVHISRETYNILAGGISVSNALNLAAYNEFNDIYKLNYDTDYRYEYDNIANNDELIKFVIAETAKFNGGHYGGYNCDYLLETLIKCRDNIDEFVSLIIETYQIYNIFFDIFQHCAYYNKPQIFSKYLGNVNFEEISGDDLLAIAIRCKSAEMITLLRRLFHIVLNVFHCAARYKNINLINELLANGEQWSPGTLQLLCDDNMNSNDEIICIEKYYAYEPHPEIIRQYLCTNNLANVEFARSIGALDSSRIFKYSTNSDVLIWLLDYDETLIGFDITRKREIPAVMEWFYKKGHLDLQEILKISIGNRSPDLFYWARQRGAKATKELFEQISDQTNVHVVEWFIQNGHNTLCLQRTCPRLVLDIPRIDEIDYLWKRWYREAIKQKVL